MLRENRIRRQISTVNSDILIRLGDPADIDKAEELIRNADSEISIRRRDGSDGPTLVLSMNRRPGARATQFRHRAKYNNAAGTGVNELGVAEPLVQRQGLDRIVVQLPGVQDPAQAERVLGATATLEFRMVCDGENALEAQRIGRAPLGCELYSDRQGDPVLLKRRTIVSGDQLIDASSGFSEGQPAVFVRLDSSGSRSMLENTKKNLKKRMAVVFVEQKRDTVERAW